MTLVLPIVSGHPNMNFTAKPALSWKSM